MKSISLLASLAAVSAVCLSFSCSSKSDSNAGGAGTSAGGTSATEGGSGGSTSKAGNTGTGTAGDDTTGTAGDGNNGAAGDGTGGGTTGGVCASLGNGVLLEGDPKNPALQHGPTTATQGILDTPPIRNEAVAVIGNNLFIETEQEVWMSDLSATPRTLKRIAGKEGSGVVNAGVSCADTRFLVVRDMAATADGKLVLIDYVGGAVIEISDPGGANCKSDWVAGTHAMAADPGADYPLNHGDMDGPGVSALFGGDPAVTGTGGGGIHKVTVDPTGNIYTYDEGTGKFKMIATDKDRTVSTIGQITSTDDVVQGLAFLKGKIYITGYDSSNDFLQVLDPATYKVATPKANVKDVFRNRGDQFPEVSGSGHLAGTSQVVSDGEALIISGQIQFVWRVATDGTVLATLAGSSSDRGPGRIDFDADFDPTVPHAADKWELQSILSAPDGGPWLALGGGNLYWSGGGDGRNYMLQFGCK